MRVLQCLHGAPGTGELRGWVLSGTWMGGSWGGGGCVFILLEVLFWLHPLAQTYFEVHELHQCAGRVTEYSTVHNTEWRERVRLRGLGYMDSCWCPREPWGPYPSSLQASSHPSPTIDCTHKVGLAGQRAPP